MKILINGIHYKNVNKKYAGIADIGNYFEYLELKRLSASEKLALDTILLQGIFEEQFQWFMYQMEVKEPFIFELVKNSPLVKTIKVTTKHQVYFVAKFRNKTEIRCPGLLYARSPVKEQVNRLF